MKMILFLFDFICYPEPALPSLNSQWKHQIELLLGQAALVLKSCQALILLEGMMSIHLTWIHIMKQLQAQAFVTDYNVTD